MQCTSGRGKKGMGWGRGRKEGKEKRREDGRKNRKKGGVGEDVGNKEGS